MRPTAGHRGRPPGPVRFRELAVGGIAVALENALPPGQMAFDASRSAAVFEAIDDNRRPGSSIGAIVPQISPQPTLARSPTSGRQDWQCRLVGKNPVAGADELEQPICERFEMESDMANPAGHEIAPEFDLLARKDRLLPIERQAVGVLGNGDAG